MRLVGGWVADGSCSPIEQYEAEVALFEGRAVSLSLWNAWSTMRESVPDAAVYGLLSDIKKFIALLPVGWDSEMRIASLFRTLDRALAQGQAITQDFSERFHRLKDSLSLSGIFAVEHLLPDELEWIADRGVLFLSRDSEDIVHHYFNVRSSMVDLAAVGEKPETAGVEAETEIGSRRTAETLIQVLDKIAAGVGDPSNQGSDLRGTRDQEGEAKYRLWLLASAWAGVAALVAMALAAWM